MNSTMCTRAGLAAALVAITLSPGPARAQVVIATVPEASERQEGLRLDGFVVEGGIASPVHGDNGFLFGLRAGMGTLFSRHLDFSLGLRHWSADIDRSEFGTATSGTFNDTSLDAVLSYPLMKVLGMRPYVGAGLAGHTVGADVPGDRSLEDALSGTNFGALGLIGLGTTRPGLGLRLEARRDLVDDVGAWTYTMGVGWWPRTRAQDAHLPVSYETRSVRPAEVNISAAAPSAAVPVQPAPTTPVPAAGATEQELITALNHLKRQNEELAGNLAKLQQNLQEEQAAARVVPDEPVPVQAPAPEVAPQPDRSTQLFNALQRATAMAGHPHSLNRTGDSGLLTLDQSLLFASGASELTTGAREELRRLGVVLLRFPEVQVVVQGHSDAVGRPAANEALSQRRAEAVRSELLSLGIRAETIRAVGYGDTRPIASNETADGRARNRRVDLLITMPSSLAN